MINGIVPDCGLSKLDSTRSTRKGCDIVPILLDEYCESFKSKQRDSLLHTGVELLNALLLSVRKITGDLLEFQSELTQLLSFIPDQPAAPIYSPEARDKDDKPSNCIIDWLRIIDVSTEFLVPTTDDLYQFFFIDTMM